MTESCTRWLKQLIRKKTFTEEELQHTNLRRCLTTLNLIGIGCGASLGAGVYILVGQVARNTAGPANLVSYAFAGVAACLVGLCLAEFACRVPRAGSAYVYSYVTVGELMAFIIGWSILLEYIIAASSLARALSGYVDYMTGFAIRSFFQRCMPLSVPGFSAYPDFFALGLVAVVTGIVSLGVKESALFQQVVNVVNLITISLIIISGFFKADLHNWNLSGEELPAGGGAGSGGFFPFGFSGAMSGAATCFFSFSGFDILATLGEEAENPRKSIPISMAVTLLISLVSFCGTSAVITLMCPYYLITDDAPMPFVFDYVGWGAAKYGINVGALSGMTASLIGAMFPMSRVTYSMAHDGLIFSCFAWISPHFKTPYVGTIVAGALAGVLTLFLELSELVHMLAIGTILAFTLEAICVLILRYETQTDSPHVLDGVVDKTAAPMDNGFTLRHLVRPSSGTPTPVSACIANTCIACMCVLLCVFSAFTVWCSSELADGTGWSVAVAVTLFALALLALFFLACQPQNHPDLYITVPLVPYIPATSCVVNIYLMFQLGTATWIRLVVWMVLGLSIYFFYGLRHSRMNQATEELTPLCLYPTHNHYTTLHTPVSSQHNSDDTEDGVPPRTLK